MERISTEINPDTVVAIGAGPANLSFAALMRPFPEIETVLFEKKERLSWHSGLMLADSKLQTNALKDLVTPVDPTNNFSFLCYLQENNRLYSGLVSGLGSIDRIEFEDYLRWASCGVVIKLVTR